jgi:hypothetical protein
VWDDNKLAVVLYHGGGGNRLVAMEEKESGFCFALSDYVLTNCGA